MTSIDAEARLSVPLLQVGGDPVPRGADPLIAVVIPCYRVTPHILDVVAGIPTTVARIYVVDDACPDGSGGVVEKQCIDPRVTVIRLAHNLGVGGAVMAGYRRALEDGMQVIVKMDGDGQMDPLALPQLVAPILRREADYTKGNRFYDLAQIGRMPRARIVGNALLSFMTKISSGYWDIFDPTNGYTAIHAEVLRKLPLKKVSSRYFFESDLLFRLNIVRAVVVDVPMDARYGLEESNLKITRAIGTFAIRHARNSIKRIFYSYFLRDMSLASIQLVLGTVFVLVGGIMGGYFWIKSVATGELASAGTVMLVALQIMVGIQLLLGFLAYDIAAVPRRALQKLLSSVR